MNQYQYIYYKEQTVLPGGLVYCSQESVDKAIPSVLNLISPRVTTLSSITCSSKDPLKLMDGCL
jgi:hypothetical protein